MKWNKIIVLTLCTLLFVGCSFFQTPEQPVRQQVTEPVEVVEEPPIEEDVEITEEEELLIEQDGVDLDIGDCPHPFGDDCREDMPVCGSDDRTYEDRCVACDNPSVEWWIEGTC